MKLKHHIVPAAASVFPASFATLPAASVKFATIENYWDFEGGMRIRISLFVYSVLFVLGLGVSPALGSVNK